MGAYAGTCYRQPMPTEFEVSLSMHRLYEEIKCNANVENMVDWGS